VTVPTSFTQLFILVIQVRNLTHSCQTIAQQSSHFTRWKPDERVTRFVRHDLSNRTGALDHLATLTGRYFNVMNKRTRWKRS
tara:strand:+ start:1608 stop:1853 length:246 start_codon:yes stop_codon:yes gene_type:complete